LIIAALKSRVPERFRKWIPIVAPILGEALASLATNLPHGSGLIAGLAGVGLREIKDQHLPAAEAANNSGKGGADKIGAALGLILLAFVCFCASGCTGGAQLIRAAAQDKSPSTLQIRTVYGTVVYSRAGGSTNQVEITDTGSIKQNK
jgi:hypothetical protein